jgi:hypothetical protein
MKTSFFSRLLISTIISLFSLTSAFPNQTHAKSPRSRSQSIRVLSPNGDEKIQKGDTYQIKWSSKAIDDNLTIELLHNEKIVGTIAHNINVHSKGYNWKVGEILKNEITGGTGYRIAIKTENGTMTDTSDRPFAIIVPGATQSSPLTANQQIHFQKDKVITKKPVTTMEPQTATTPDTSHLPDFVVDKFELIPKYAFLGEPYEIRIWFKEYPRLGKSPWVEIVRENTLAPALLRRTDKKAIPVTWKSNSPEITVSYAAEQLIDISVQQKKRLTVTMDINNDISEKNEANNIITHDFRLYPPGTKMADLIFYDHAIKNLTSESQYYFKSESPNYEKKVNQPVKIWGYVINYGNETARPFKIKMRGDDNRDLNTKFTKIIQVNKRIAPNEVYTFSTYVTWTSPGLKVCLFELDIDDEVIESDEDNNISVGTCTLRIAQ